MGSFENPLGNADPEAKDHNQDSISTERQAETIDPRLIKLADHAWNELPFVMMRITGTNRVPAWKDLYWRDQTLELGEIDLNLATSSIDEQPRSYTATYSVDELRRAVITRVSPKPVELRRIFTVYPSLEGDEVRWNAPDLSPLSNLTSQQIAERLVGKLVTFYAQGLR